MANGILNTYLHAIIIIHVHTGKACVFTLLVRQQYPVIDYYKHVNNGCKNNFTKQAL